MNSQSLVFLVHHSETGEGKELASGGHPKEEEDSESWAKLGSGTSSG